MIEYSCAKIILKFFTIVVAIKINVINFKRNSDIARDNDYDHDQIILFHFWRKFIKLFYLVFLRDLYISKSSFIVAIQWLQLP